MRAWCCSLLRVLAHAGGALAAVSPAMAATTSVSAGEIHGFLWRFHFERYVKAVSPDDDDDDDDGDNDDDDDDMILKIMMIMRMLHLE